MRLPRTMLAAPLLLASLLITTPARADSQPSFASAPTSVTVGTESIKSYTASVAGTDDLSELQISWTLTGEAGMCTVFEYGTESQTSWTARIDPNDLDDSCLGHAMTLEADVSGFDPGDNFVNVTLKRNVVLKAATRIITNNATPEPARRGGLITITATLQRASWNWLYGNKYAGTNPHSTKLQYHRDGAPYANVATVSTTSGGHLRHQRRATYSGSFRYVYAGSANLGASTAVGDHVVVH